MRLFSRLIGTLLLLGLPAGAMAAQQSFTDVPSDSPYFTAAEFLKTNGILQGYDDGTFRPEQTVNRAEVIKIIVSNRVPLAGTQSGSDLTSPFKDILPDAWYLPFVVEAYDTLRIIDGPPKNYTFAPERVVTRIEFLKMLLLAYEVDPLNSYGEITYPLSEDVTDVNVWYYPYIRYALTASMLNAENGKLEPAAELTRGEIAEMLYRFLIYREGKRTQTVLSVSENETLTSLRMLESGNTDAAGYGAARAILAARGALAVQPLDGTTKASVKTSEAAMSLVSAARAQVVGDASKTVDSASTAWHLAAKAKEFSGTLNALADQIQKKATEIAGSARTTN